MKEKEYLDGTKLVNGLRKFENEKNNLEINIVFVNSNFERKEKYKCYTLLTDENDILPTIESSLNYLKGELENRSFEKYDLELSIDETVQTVEEDKVVNGNVLIESMKNVVMDDSKVLDKDVKLDNLNFIVIQVYDPKERKNLYLFQKYVHPTTKYKNTLKFTFHGKKAVPFKAEIITISSIVDAILYDGAYYILNRKSFNSIFNFKDLFYKVINDNKQSIRESKLFQFPDTFIRDCMEDGRYLPRLTKVILAKGFESVEKNKSKLKGMKEQYGLSFELTRDGKMKYSDKKQISDIINVLLDHFVISALTDKKMLAKAIEKYEI